VNIMKKLLIIALAALFAPAIYAGTATLTYTATILADVTVTVSPQPNFGSFYLTGTPTGGTATLPTTGSTVTTSPSGTGSALSPIANSNATSGLVTVTQAASTATVALTVPATITMTSGGNSPLTVTPVLAQPTCALGSTCTTGVGIGGSFTYGTTPGAGTYTNSSGVVTATFQ
jgi:hypothetical protein